jgi:hypothetical protein
VFHQPEVRTRRALEVGRRTAFLAIHSRGALWKTRKRCGPGGCPRRPCGLVRERWRVRRGGAWVIEPSAAPALPSRSSQLCPCRGRVLGFAPTRTRLAFAAVSGSHGGGSGRGPAHRQRGHIPATRNGPRSSNAEEAADGALNGGAVRGTGWVGDVHDGGFGIVGADLGNEGLAVDSEAECVQSGRG